MEFRRVLFRSASLARATPPGPDPDRSKSRGQRFARLAPRAVRVLGRSQRCLRNSPKRSTSRASLSATLLCSTTVGGLTWDDMVRNHTSDLDQPQLTTCGWGFTRDGIVVREARVAIAVDRIGAYGSTQPLGTEVPERVRLEVFGDLVHGLAVRDQLPPRRRVDAVEARTADRR